MISSRQPGDVGDVDLHRAVAQRFHELVVLQAAIFRLVGVAEDDLVDVGLGELLRLDLVFLRRAEQVVEERHVELQHLDELDEAAVGDVQFAVEVERPRVAVGAVLGDLAVVDVAGQFGRVLVLLVLGLERADADAVLLGQDQAVDLDLVRASRCQSPSYLASRSLNIVAAERAQVALDRDLVVVGACGSR